MIRDVATSAAARAADLRRDPVPGVGLDVLDLEPAGPELGGRRRPKPTSMIGSAAPWWINTGKPGAAVEVGLPSVDRRDEPAERDDARGPRPPGAEADRVRHHSSHREPADHGPLPADPALGEQGVEPRAEIGVARGERRRIGIADPGDEVPVPPARRNSGERRAGGDAEQAPLGIELVEQRPKIALVGPSAVVEDRAPSRLTVRLADDEVEPDPRDGTPSSISPPRAPAGS